MKLGIDKTNFEKVSDFMQACDQEINSIPTISDMKTRSLRISLIEEELNEFKKAINDGDIIDVADSLSDLLYVIYGAGHSFGIDLDRCFNEVHRSNMSKLVDGKCIKNEMGKVMKGPNYNPPDFRRILIGSVFSYMPSDWEPPIDNQK